MKFILTYDWIADPDVKAESIRRFLTTGGAPPAGVTLLGRWTRADLSGGYGLVETEDVQKLTEFAFAWNDLMTLSATPVLEDQALAMVFQSGAATA